MKTKLRFFCFSFLLLSMFWVLESKGDIDFADWGEMVENNNYINIQVEDAGVKVHKRIEAKLRKFLSDDYVFAFSANSLLGQLETNSLRLITPTAGIADSVFENGFKLDYLSRASIEDTMEFALEYELRYPAKMIGTVLFKNIKATARHYYTYGAIIDTNACFDITCNRKMQLRQRWSGFSDWSTVGEGTHIVYHPGYHYDTRYLDLKLTFSEEGPTDTITERIYFDVVPEHWNDYPNLIKREAITIEFTEANEETFNYCLDGAIELDVEAASRFAPFYAWFPNDQNNAIVILDYSGWYYYDYYYSDTTWWHYQSCLKVEPSVMFGQKGFYILIPYLNDSSDGYVRKCQKAKLLVAIEGVQSEKSCDFILVTAPQEYSSVKFKIPQRFSFGNCHSPFEQNMEFQEEEFQVKKFYGRCPSTGIAHVEWQESWPISREDLTLFQNHPNPFNQETVIRYNLPEDALVRLTVYNLLGEKVIRLVDRFQQKDRYEIKWNGRDQEGYNVASGIYFYRIEAGDFAQSKKMVVVK